MRSHDTTTRRLGLAWLLAFAACGARTKEPPPAAREQGPAGAPGPTDTRTQNRPSGQPANSPTPGPSAGVANPGAAATPEPGTEPPGGAAKPAPADADRPK